MIISASPMPPKNPCSALALLDTARLPSTFMEANQPPAMRALRCQADAVFRRKRIQQDFAGWTGLSKATRQKAGYHRNLHGRTGIAQCKFERSASSERERNHLRVRLRQNRYKTARETQEHGPGHCRQRRFRCNASRHQFSVHNERGETTVRNVRLSGCGPWLRVTTLQ